MVMTLEYFGILNHRKTDIGCWARKDVFIAQITGILDSIGAGRAGMIHNFNDATR